MLWLELVGGWAVRTGGASSQLRPKNIRNPYAFGWKWRQYMIFLIFLIFAVFFFFPFFFEASYYPAGCLVEGHTGPASPLPFFFPGSSFQILVLMLPWIFKGFL